MIEHFLNRRKVFSVDRHVAGGGTAEIVNSHIREVAAFTDLPPCFLNSCETPWLSVVTTKNPLTLTTIIHYMYDNLIR